MFFGTSTQISALPSLRKHVPFDPIADMAPIGGIGVNSFFRTVHPDLPVRTLKELVAYGRANPGKLNAGSSSATASIAPTLFAATENFKIQVIPYKSETTALNDLICGRIRGLATMLTGRSKALPDLPTMAESGITPFAAILWMGLFGPAKMPTEIVERLSRELLATLQKSEVREQIERQARRWSVTSRAS